MNRFRSNSFIATILLSIFLFVNTQPAVAYSSGIDSDDTNPELNTERTASDQAIQPYQNNPWYWQYKGEPVMLLGASDRDNLWQWTGQRLTDHLDRMQATGGARSEFSHWLRTIIVHTWQSSG